MSDTPSQDDVSRETLGFQSEAKQLLHLMIHSLYSNREIFLRELISNASDAADKLRFAALADGSLYEDDPELAIQISYDKDSNTLSISDNGIGMNREDLINNLGTIARSGTDQCTLLCVLVAVWCSAVTGGDKHQCRSGNREREF